MGCIQKCYDAGCDECDEMPGLDGSAALSRAAHGIWEGFPVAAIFKWNKVRSVTQVLAVTELSVSN